MLVDRPLVESVDRRRLGESVAGNDVPRDGFDRCQAAAREKEPRARTREGARDRGADRTSGSVNYRNFFLQHQLLSFRSDLIEDVDTGASENWAVHRPGRVWAGVY